MDDGRLATMVDEGALLLAEDHELFRERLARAFRERGFLVFTAGNYKEAMTIAQELKAGGGTLARAVVDQRMPGRSGLDLITGLKEVYPDVSVLVLTGFGSISTAVDAVHRGAINYLPKPADVEEILAAFDRGEGVLPDDDGAEESDGPPPTPSLAQAEWEHIHRVLADCNGNISETARRLGIHRRSLQRKLRKRSPE